MHDSVASPLVAWESFYVIVGSSAAALTGLMFVVIALVAETQPREREIQAFGTPTVIHFCAVLLISAVLSAPWPDFTRAGWLVGFTGWVGVCYAILVARRARRVTEYRPVLEDWVWHVVLPLIAYATLVVAALKMRADPVAALFTIGAASVLLLFVGIHNAWDTVTYIALDRLQRPQKGKPPRRPRTP